MFQDPSAHLEPNIHKDIKLVDLAVISWSIIMETWALVLQAVDPTNQQIQRSPVDYLRILP
jgi:hypothetical protein